MKIKKLLVLLMLSVPYMFAFTACSNRDNIDTDNLLCGGPPVYESEMAEFIANFDKHSPFVDNQIIVTLTEEATFKYIFHDYTVEDFSEIGAIDVDELDGATNNSSGLTYKVRQCLSEDSSGNTLPEHLKHYNRSFCITLEEKNEDNVLRAVYLLRQRTDIYFAEPNWIESADV